MCSGAAAGALFSCVILCLPVEGGPPILVLLHGGCSLLMLRLAYGIKKGSLLMKALVMLYMTAFLTGGFWEAVLKSGITIPAFFIFAFATYMGIGALVCAADSARIMRKNIYPITLSYQGKKQSAYGLYDTGNMLDDPLSGAPVSVVKPELLEMILSKDLIERLKHLHENPGGDSKYGNRRIEAALSVLQDSWTGGKADAGGFTRGSLYSYSRRRGSCIRSGAGACLSNPPLWERNTRYC